MTDIEKLKGAFAAARARAKSAPTPGLRIEAMNEAKMLHATIEAMSPKNKRSGQKSGSRAGREQYARRYML